MTYLEFENLVNEQFDQYEKTSPGDWRIGQVYFNLLFDIRPDIAEEMRGSIVDPFFKRRITEVVRSFVTDRWDTQ
jgi:hypothetical protein